MRGPKHHMGQGGIGSSHMKLMDPVRKNRVQAECLAVVVTRVKQVAKNVKSRGSRR